MNNKVKYHSDIVSSNDQENITYSLNDIFLIIANYVKILIVIPLFFGLGSIIYVSFFSKSIYTSTSKIMSSSSSGGLSQAMGLAAQFGIALPTANNSKPNWVYPEILKSRSLAKEVLNRKFDSEEFGSQKKLSDILLLKDKNTNNSLQEINSRAVEKFMKMISVSENIKTKIYTVSVNASEAKLARDINEVLIEELDKHQKKYNKGQTREAKKFIEERIVEIEKELIISEEILKNFIDRNRRIENSPSLQLQQQRLDREVMVLISVFTTLKQQYETTKIEELKDSQYVVILDPPVTPLLRSKPRKTSSVISGTILGGVLGIILIFFIEFFKNSKEIEKNKMTEAKLLILKNIKDLFFVKK